MYELVVQEFSFSMKNSLHSLRGAKTQFCNQMDCHCLRANCVKPFDFGVLLVRVTSIACRPATFDDQFQCRNNSISSSTVHGHCFCLWRAAEASRHPLPVSGACSKAPHTVTCHCSEATFGRRIGLHLTKNESIVSAVRQQSAYKPRKCSAGTVDTFSTGRG